MNVRAHVTIAGLVQGVFFRAHTRDFAGRFNVKGWVRNTHEGNVEAVFEGDGEDVKALIDWCHDGPPGARVSAVDVKWEDYKGEFNGFEIVYR